MLTIFSVPKAFKGHIGIIQENAIKSWILLHSKCEIVLYGDEEGIKEICDKYNLIHVPSIKKNEYGTPTLDYIFENIQKIAKNKFLCYVNADIIFFNDLISTIKRTPFQRFLIVGQRRDVEITDYIRYDELNWDTNIKEQLKKKPLNFCGGIDYFLFPKGLFMQIPPFMVGRAGWDNYMIYLSRKLNIPTIDATQIITAIHQNHSYFHIPQGNGNNYSGPESNTNFILSGNRRIYLWDLNDVDWVFTFTDLIHKRISLRGYFRLLILKCPNFCHPLFETGFWIQHVIRRLNVK